MKQLYELIRKDIVDYHLSADDISFQTECGKKISVHSTEIKGWSSFSFSNGLSRTLGKKLIFDISIYPEKIIFYFANGSREYIYTNTLSTFSDIKKSKNGMELLLTMETIRGHEIVLHYFKTPNGWSIAEFNQQTDSIYLKIARKYDIINDPSIRIKTLV